MGGEEGAFEGKVPIADIEKAICAQVNAKKKTARFIFDDFVHETEDEFLKFLEQFGQPDFVLFITAEEKTVK